jgi:hypothetical protein
MLDPEASMSNEWDLSKYQIEAAAQALEAVWGAIRSHKIEKPGTMFLQDIEHVIRMVQGGYNGAGALLLMLKSEKTAKGQIAKIADLCKRVGSFEDFANKHKVALTGVAFFLEFVTFGSRMPQEVQMLARGAARVAKKLFSEYRSPECIKKASEKKSAEVSRKLSCAPFHHMIRLLKQKAIGLPIPDRLDLEHLLITGEKKIKESKSLEEASSVYKEMIHKMIGKLKLVQNLSVPGRTFRRFLETEGLTVCVQ